MTRMINASTGIYLSFTTKDRNDAKSWSAAGESIRLELAAALEQAGVEIDRKMHPLEADWLFYGVRDGKRFTVVLTIIEFSPCTWFIFMEGASPTEQPDPAVRAWAQPILEATIRTRDGVANLRWYDTHLTLPGR